MNFLPTTQISLMELETKPTLTSKMSCDSMELNQLTAAVSPTVIQFLQLQSFQMMKENIFPWYQKPLYHIQWLRKAYPYTTASLEAIVLRVNTFQAGSHRVFSQFDRAVVNWLKPASLFAQFGQKMRSLMKDQMAVRFQALMLPVPCQPIGRPLVKRELKIRKNISPNFLLFSLLPINLFIIQQPNIIQINTLKGIFFESKLHPSLSNQIRFIFIVIKGRGIYFKPFWLRF